MTSRDAPMNGPGDAREPASRGHVLLVSFAAVLGIIVVLFGLILALAFLADQKAAPNLLANIYDLLGKNADATALRSGQGDRTVAKLLMTVVAIVIGVGGVWLFYIGANALVEHLGIRWQRRLLPWVFIGPAVVLLTVFLVYPAVATIALSFTESGGAIKNYQFAFTDPGMVAAFKNNIIWLVVGTVGAVGLGLLIAALFDRVKHESVAKTFIFLPLAISLIGASVIWRFVYTWRPPGQAQYGLLNAVWTALGGQPVAFVQTAPVNTFALIVILIWLQTGFCMVILSAAIKGVPAELSEAAKLDGASERQLFWRITVPMIKGSIVTVTITTAIVVLKIFDIVFVMTGGRFDTDVVANRMFVEMFQFGDYGRSAALAVILFLAVIPLMILNVRGMDTRGLKA
jgi:alpha-glucoside transport system permease protein